MDQNAMRSTGLDYLERLVSGDVAHPPAAELIGFRWVEAEFGRVVVELEAKPIHGNLMGSLHGGIICAIADAAMGGAYGSTLGPGEAHTTLELKINFLKPVWNSRLRAEGTVVKRGRTIGLAECEVKDADDSLVAKTSGTFMTLRGDEASGRRMVER